MLSSVAVGGSRAIRPFPGITGKFSRQRKPSSGKVAASPEVRHRVEQAVYVVAKERVVVGDWMRINCVVVSFCRGQSTRLARKWQACRYQGAPGGDRLN